MIESRFLETYVNHEIKINIVFPDSDSDSRNGHIIR
jgi:hypothetical protein